jgi:hypothetical protein
VQNNSQLFVNSNLTYVGLQNATYLFGVDPLFAVWTSAKNGSDICPEMVVGNLVQEKNVTHGQSFTSGEPIVGCNFIPKETYVLNVLPRFGQTSLAFGQNLQISLNFVPLVGKNSSTIVAFNSVATPIVSTRTSS